ncbi:unnamed protein product [Bemisia tabaci]|uniref:ATP-binding cassette sub-family B member 6 n=1 Tax=Bemisia tabaci TaxID=7038 RepID=A0A9P0AH13_BEMTA|nr:unnamed protein product [Bemisia tabaci]
MMKFCPPNVTFSEIWVNHGVSQCFMETVYAGLLVGFLFIFGTIQLFYYRKYSTPVMVSFPASKLFRVQIAITVLLAVVTISRFVVEAIIINHGIIYGYMIFSTVGLVSTIIFSLILIFKERHYLLPSIPSCGHGLVLLIFWSILFIGENLTFINLGRSDWWFQIKTKEDKIEMALFVTRYLLCSVIFILGLRAPGIITSREYFNLTNSAAENMESGPNVESNQSTWHSGWKKIKTLMPFLWPRKSIFLQLRVLICFTLLIGGRLTNFYVPKMGQEIVDSMTGTTMVFPWELVVIYAGLKLLQGGGTGGTGLLNNVRSVLWVSVQQYNTRELEVSLFSHLHGLSLGWHLSRKTGEVLRIMDRGANSINNILSYILFNLVPTLVDIVVAIVYFIVAFNVWYGLIVFTTMFLYLVATIGITEWRTKFQRSMNLKDNAVKARTADSLLNFETVKYYCAEDFEVQEYRHSIFDYQKEEWKTQMSLALLNLFQNTVICIGLLIGTLLCVHQVTIERTLTIGDYFLFTTYIFQLYVPLNWFGTFYRAIQGSFIDMENMFELMDEAPDVLDAPDAPPLVISKGQIDFRNVSFSYQPEKMILKNINFTVPGGKTVALVGPSGSGKSTIVRLLFRFYDANSGAVLVDGQNIKTVLQKSLREVIGVVPQDTVLFNNSIKFNIAYGRISATDSEIVAAAQNADIHEKILTFPKGYDTVVGERGLKLSGGEKQRIAIARTILKAPSIILLDEATSSLDTQTERNIQTALARVSANKTTLIVAHRLSTVINADEILVLKEGEIVERGRHEELLNLNGLYASMWNEQQKSQKQSDAENSGTSLDFSGDLEKK